jgi:arylsulfatase A-like enzyme
MRSGPWLVSALLLGAACSPTVPPPDVVLVIIDTLRADRTSVMPGGPQTTPRLAAWAEDGVVYSQAVAPSSWTLPSMASMLSGQPVAHNRSAVFPDRPLLAERFADAGYRTVGLVANPLLTEDNGFTRGFESYDVAPAQSTASLRASIHDLRAWDAEALVSRAIEAVGDTPDDTPLFLYLHLMDPHIPYDPANGKLAQFEPGWSFANASDMVAWTDALDANDAGLLGGWRQNYDGQVVFSDRALGRLFDNLAETRTRSALVAVTSDHGEGLFTHRRNPDSPGGEGLYQGYDDHGEQVYEEAIRVPLWLVGPGVPAGRTETRPVALYDLSDTLLSLAGLTSGRRSLPLSAGDDVPPEIFGCGTRGWFLRTGDHKLVVPNQGRADRPGVRTRLYEVEADAYRPELQDLSRREAETYRSFLERWEGWVTDLSDQTEAPVDEATLERMRALGYVR